MGNKAEAKKAALVEEVRAARREVLEAARRLPVEKRGEVFLGSWSAWEILAHLAGWDAANGEAVEAIQAGRLPEFYENHDRGWASFNARLVVEYRRGDWEAQLELVEDSHRKLLRVVEQTPAEAIGRDFGVRFRGYRVTIQRLLEAEAKDEREHAGQLNRELGRAI